MAGKRELKVVITGDSTSGQRAISQLGGASNKVRGSVLKLGAAIGGAFAIKKGFDFAKGLVADAVEANKVGRQTQAVIRSTGGAANVTGKQVAGLAERLSNMAAVDDELIQSGSNVLLTFTKVRNEVGQGNAVFDRGTKAALDMSVALKQDMKSSAIQVGKALNDPIKGLTSLGRAGIQFTQQQKDQIKTLVESGDVLGAQKIILGELETQFGGSAKAAATPMERLGVIVGNLRERLGNYLLPIVEKVSNFLIDHMPGAFAFVERAVASLSDALGPIIRDAQMFFNALRTGFTEDEGTPIERLALTIREDLLPIFGRVVDFVRSHLKPILIGLGAVLMAVSPVALIAGLVLLYARFKGIRVVVGAVVKYLSEQFSNLLAWAEDVWPKIQEAVTHVVHALQTVWRTFGDNILAVARIAWNYVRGTIENAINVIRNVIQLVLALINGDWGEAWEAIRGIVSAVWDQITLLISTAMDAIKLGLETAGEALGIVVKAIWDAIKSTATTVWGGIKAVVKGTFDKIVELALNWTIAGRVIKHFDDIKAGARRAVDAVVGFFARLPGRIGDLVGGIGEAAASAGSAVLQGIVRGLTGAVSFVADIGKAVYNALANLINKHVIGGLNDALEFNLKIRGVGFSVNAPDIPDVPTLHGGGEFHAPFGRREGLALLRDGERVQTPAQARASSRREHRAPASVVVENFTAITNASAAELAGELMWLVRTGGVSVRRAS